MTFCNYATFNAIPSVFCFWEACRQTDKARVRDHEGGVLHFVSDLKLSQYDEVVKNPIR